MRSLACVLALVTTAVAQSEDPKLPSQREGERRGPPGMMPGMGKSPMRYEGFEKLSEEERQKVRAAFEKAWQRPEVIELRDQAMKVNAKLREQLRKAVQEIDPEVAKTLEKVKPPFPLDQRGLPEMPQPDSPEFGRMAAIRLGAEMMTVAKPERREETRRFHDRILQLPRVREALEQLEQLPPDQRMEAFKKLRDTYREVAAQEATNLREKFESKDGVRRPPPPQKAPEPVRKE